MSSTTSIRRNIRVALRFRWAALLLAVVTLTGCGQDAPVSLDAPARTLIDTLYLQEVRTLRVELDSLCEAEFEARVASAIDSILPIRRAEEQRLRQRIPLRQ